MAWTVDQTSLSTKCPFYYTVDETGVDKTGVDETGVDETVVDETSRSP